MLGEVELARRLGAVRRWLIGARRRRRSSLAAVYWFALRDLTVDRQRSDVPRAGLDDRRAAKTRSGSAPTAGSSASSTVPTERRRCRELPLEAKCRRATAWPGHVLKQAQVLGAAPAALRPYVERSYYGESGVDVILTTGIELRFGDASQAKRKWKAAAAVLADPSVTALDYVDLHAPTHPAVGGSRTRACRPLHEARHAAPCER